MTDFLPARSRKPRGQGASRRGEILDAAKRIFIEEGYAQATMRRIAAAVGVSPTAIYLHFSDKDAILKAIAEDFFAELLVKLQQTQTHEGPKLQRLRAGLRAYVDFSLERPDEYRLTFQAKQNEMTAERCEPDVADLSFAVLESAVEELLAEGLFRPGDPAVIAESIWAAMHGVTAVVMDMMPRVQATKDQLIETVINAVITGFACREPVLP
ncbi:MAG TPA: TetR/AcrR family transcriptional regulator [Acetobacteraceae bacterium]|nr:TetR/AcrR family transcriptional regulator [Acetobacteraceae bacterium]